MTWPLTMLCAGTQKTTWVLNLSMPCTVKSLLQVMDNMAAAAHMQALDDDKAMAKTKQNKMHTKCQLPGRELCSRTKQDCS